MTFAPTRKRLFLLLVCLAVWPALFANRVHAPSQRADEASDGIERRGLIGGGESADCRQPPDRLLPAEAVPDLVPDLAVEILSKSNTPAEMERKLREYFDAGTRLVWYVYPERREIEVFTSPGDPTLLSEDDVVTGSDVVPGFELPIREWFARAGQRREA